MADSPMKSTVFGLASIFARQEETRLSFLMDFDSPVPFHFVWFGKWLFAVLVSFFANFLHVSLFVSRTSGLQVRLFLLSLVSGIVF